MFRVLLGVSIDAVGLTRLPSVFAKAGAEVTLVCGPGLAISASRFIHERIDSQPGRQAVCSVLEQCVAARPGFYDWVVLGDEPLLWGYLAGPERPALAGATRMLAGRSVIAELISKIEFNRNAERFGIAVPRFKILGSAAQLNAEHWDGVPMVIKSERSMSGSGVRVVRARAEIAAVKQQFSEGRVLVQEYAHGPVGATAVLFDRGVPRCWFSYLLHRQWPTPHTSASALEIFWHPEIEPMLERLGTMTSVSGLCGVDWVFDAEAGKIIVLEVNPRPTPGLHLAHYAGVSFPAAIRAWLAGEERVQRPAPSRSPSIIRMFPQNLFRSTDDHEVFEYLLTWADAPWNDPWLLAHLARRAVTYYLPQPWRAALRRMFRKYETGAAPDGVVQ